MFAAWTIMRCPLGPDQTSGQQTAAGKPPDASSSMRSGTVQCSTWVVRLD